MNARLGEYTPLWSQLDDLIALLPEDYRQGRTWRQGAETRMREEGRDAMDANAVDAFVDYCWKAVHPALFLESLRRESQLPGIAIQLGEGRLPASLRELSRSLA